MFANPEEDAIQNPLLHCKDYKPKHCTDVNYLYPASLLVGQIFRFIDDATKLSLSKHSISYPTVSWVTDDELTAPFFTAKQF
jgi:hypothetical protein